MKLHLGRYLGLMAVLGCAAFAAAQDRPLEDMPLEVRTAAQLTEVQSQEIHQYITGWTGVLADNSNPQQQGVARDKLVNGVVSIGTETASVSYQNTYSKELNDALMPLTKRPDVRSRLLAGIVAGGVADRTGNVALQPLAMALLADKSDAVVIWGMRTARYVLTTLLQIGNDDSPLGPQMAAALKNHPGVPIANAAYDACDLSNVTAPQPLLAAAKQALLLLHTRVGVYIHTSPIDPSADSVATTFLSIRAWNYLSPEQRLDAVQQISNMLSVMAQRCQADGNDLMPRMISGLQFVAKAIYVIGTTEQSTNVLNAIKPVAEQHFTSQTPAQDIVSLVQKIYPALITVPDFAKLKPPPTIESGATSQPSE